MKRDYTPEELRRLHAELYDILGEVVRICQKYHIPYFVIGGTAIGAYYDEEILPWDDDIDIGMVRGDYERFLRVAPGELGSRYFLQWPGSEPQTPFYFAKVRKEGTLFVEEDFASLPIHHGIFVDIFPFDRVPGNAWLQKAQRLAANFVNCCFMGKTLWMWRYFGKCRVARPSARGPLPCLLTRVAVTLLSKRALYRLLSAVQRAFNRWDTTFFNMVLMPRDHIPAYSIRYAEDTPFGPLTVRAPFDLGLYLRHHYPGLHRDVPKEEQQNHRPLVLSFGPDRPGGTPNTPQP